jgi:fumarylacetoacetate (FAA) hydrolase
MKLATLVDGTPDGALIVVSPDGERFIAAGGSLQAALDDWDAALPALRRHDAAVRAGGGEAFADRAVAAPLPRAWQWLDASAFPSHGALMQRAFGLPPIETELPLMYQGLSDRFIGPRDDVPLPSEADGIDFEGEFGVITGAVPMGVTAADALAHIRLIVQINDWSLRVLAPVEMKTGFGWVQAKPACSAAPFAVTPDELGEAWRDGRVHLPLTVDWNGARFGAASGAVMAFGFHDLVAHAARTRSLPAGTIIGSGTVSNEDYRVVGSSCIAERRGIEIVDDGKAATAFMRFGDTVRMEARTIDDTLLFGAIEQRVVQA